MNMKKPQLKKLFTNDSGRTLSADEAKMHLLDELAQGHEVLPMTECDNFDYKRGCRGHEQHNN